MSFLDKVKLGLNRTGQLLQTDVRDLFKTEGRLVDAEFLDELFELLVRTDMGVQAAQSAVDETKNKFRGRVVVKDEILEVVKSNLKALMAPLSVSPNPGLRLFSSSELTVLVKRRVSPNSPNPLFP